MFHKGRGQDIGPGDIGPDDAPAQTRPRSLRAGRPYQVVDNPSFGSSGFESPRETFVREAPFDRPTMDSASTSILAERLSLEAASLIDLS
jgi:hypothetical protein